MKALKVILSVAVAAALSASCLSSTAVAATRHAVIVVISKHSQSQKLETLPPGTAKNGEQLRVALIRGGFEDQHITVLSSDAATPNREPNRAAILSHLKALSARAQADDTIVVITISHGREVGGVSYLCPSDASDAALDQKEIADRELIAVPVITELLKSSKATHKLLVVDACRDPAITMGGFVPRLEKTPEGVCVMTSCSQKQLSYASPHIVSGDERPIFTHFMAEGLAGDADLIGNNDGQVSLFELFTYTNRKTKEAAAQIGKSQDPELFTGISTSFAVSSTGSFAPRTVTTSDPLAEQRHTALLLADRSLQLIREGEQRLKADYDSLSKAPVDQWGRPREDGAIYRDHHNRVCYALGSYIKPALTFDADCRVAHLARGFSFRSCGAYREALADYQQAHEHFDLFVKGDPASIQNYLEVDDQQQLAKNGSGEAILKIEDRTSAPIRRGQFSLFSEPRNGSKVVGNVARQSKVRVEQVSGRAGSEWLLVTAVNDQTLAQAAWLPRSQTHWFAEAADLYTPATPMNRQGGMQGNGVDKLDHAASEMHAVANKLDLPSREMEDVKNQIRAKLQPYNEVRRLPFLDRYLPNIDGYATGYISLAQAYASMPANYVRMAAGYVELPANIARSAKGWAGTTQNYYASMERTENVDARRVMLLTAKFLEPVTEERVTVENTPWQTLRTVAAQ